MRVDMLRTLMCDVCRLCVCVCVDMRHYAPKCMRACAECLCVRENLSHGICWELVSLCVCAGCVNVVHVHGQHGCCSWCVPHGHARVCATKTK